MTLVVSQPGILNDSNYGGHIDHLRLSLTWEYLLSVINLASF